MSTAHTTGTHAWQRVNERLTEAGFTADTCKKVHAAANALASKSTHRSEAIRLLALPEIVGQAWSDRSNGNEVWAIIRSQRLVTVMLRRSTQPKTATALKVDAITVI